MTIVNLRGTNGSGKSTVARALLEDAGAYEVELAAHHSPAGKPRPVIGYMAPARDLIVIGPYRTQCGGCDAVPTQDLICEAVRRASGMAEHVFFEGLLISGLYSRYRALSQELGGFTWAFLDTPLEKCLARVAGRNGGKPLKRDGETVKGKYRAILRTREKALSDGERVVDVDHTRAVEQIEALFRAK